MPFNLISDYDFLKVGGYCTINNQHIYVKILYSCLYIVYMMPFNLISDYHSLSLHNIS